MSDPKREHRHISHKVQEAAKHRPKIGFNNSIQSKAGKNRPQVHIDILRYKFASPRNQASPKRKPFIQKATRFHTISHHSDKHIQGSSKVNIMIHPFNIFLNPSNKEQNRNARETGLSPCFLWTSMPSSQNIEDPSHCFVVLTGRFFKDTRILAGQVQARRSGPCSHSNSISSMPSETM